MLTAKDIFVVGVAGGSGSGKTTLTENLIQRFSDHICVVHHDNYYKPHDDIPFEARTKLNYDCPDAFETPRLAQQLRQLRREADAIGIWIHIALSFHDTKLKALCCAILCVLRKKSRRFHQACLTKSQGRTDDVRHAARAGIEIRVHRKDRNVIPYEIQKLESQC